MLVKFSNEVLVYGPQAVLPQNLNDYWLRRMQEMADDFINGNFDSEECREPTEPADPVMTAAVTELFNARSEGSLSRNELMEKLTLYALAVTMETVRRDHAIPLEEPTPDNIFSWDRIVHHRKINQEFIEMLEKACLFKPADKGLFGQIKKKLSALRKKRG